MKTSFQTIITTTALGLFFYLVMKYQDTDAFQAAMNFLFNPDNSLTPPLFWKNYRMLLSGSAVALAFFFYIPVWASYRDVTRLYRNSTIKPERPSLSSVKASYIHRQDRTRCVVAWLAQHCSEGSLFLHYHKGMTPWSVSRTTRHGVHSKDQQLLKILFQKGDSVELRAHLQEPNPCLKEMAEKLYQDIRTDTSHVFQTPKSSLVAWLLFSLFLAEIPFSLAGQNTPVFTALPAAIFSTCLLALPGYAAFHQFPSFFGGPRVKAYILLGASVAIALVGHIILLQNQGSFRFFWRTAMFPDLSLLLAVAVYNAPLLPQDYRLLSRIIGYQKYLNRDGYQIKESDLPWTLALSVHSDVFSHSFQYDGQTFPLWLKTREGDVQAVMRILHQTLEQHVNYALNGEMKSRRRLRRGRY